jgi:hypothetical protein
MRKPVLLGAVNVAVLTLAVLVSVGGRAGENVPSAAVGATANATPGTAEPAPQATAAARPAPPATAVTATPQPEPSPTPTRTTPTSPARTTPTAPVRTTTSTGWAPYAVAGPVTLHLPGDVVEVVGLHESSHDGAQPQQPVEGRARIGLMDSRSRDTGAQGAADIVLDPRREIRSPVTGTVLRAGSYTLYCDHVDQYLVVEPDARPGWEVKLLHFEGLSVGKGERVEAGVTVVGARARTLPFASQVDDHTATPHWPHVHVEVVDPSVPDRPSRGGC